MIGLERGSGPVGRGRFADDHQGVGIKSKHTPPGMTVPADDPLTAAVELLEVLGPSMSMALVAELARLVVDVEPNLMTPMWFLLSGVLS